MNLIYKILVCIFVFGFSLYSYIDRQNEVTELKLRIPRLAKEVHAVRQENARLQYEIDLLESPERFLALSREKAYSHLKYPSITEIVTLKEGIALQFPLPAKGETLPESTAKVSLAVGAK